MEHGIDSGAVAVVSACLVLWGLVSSRLVRADVTGPIAFVVVGLVAAHGPVPLVHLQLDSQQVRSVVEVTLAIVLFADAARVDVRGPARRFGIAARLLGIGLPLTLLSGFAAAAWLVGGAGLWAAALAAAIVAPTDAALGASLVDDERIPRGVRRALNVESGLNDGIVTPFVNLFLAGALSAELAASPGVGDAVVELAGGLGIGAGVGALGAILLQVAQRAGWGAAGFRPLAVSALAVLAYSSALAAGANGFVAAFVAGLAFGRVTGNEATALVFTEQAGELLSLVVWFAFGAVLLVPGMEDATWADVGFAVLALTVVRAVPVGLALLGSGLDRATIAFIAWFGPRGLASVVFGLVAVDKLDPAASQLLLGAVTVTVVASVVLHGVSASPLARRYGDRARGIARASPEHAGDGSMWSRAVTGTRWSLRRRG